MDLIFSTIESQNALKHYGTKYHSGRYPYGSGDNPYQHDGGRFRDTVKSLRDTVNPVTGKKFTDTEIAKQLGMSTTQLRARYSLSTSAFKAEQIARALELYNGGTKNYTEIASKMGVSPNTIKNYLDPKMKERVNKTQEIANILKDQIEKKKYLDVGTGVEYQLGITDTKLKTAVAMLEDEGYKKQYLKIPQANNPGKFTNMKVLTKGDVDWYDVYENRDKVQSVLDFYSNDGGKTIKQVQNYVSIDPKRVQVRYAEDGGIKKDGVIELRPGVEDLSLNDKHYAQVRIAVGDTHYLKGMAIYNDNLPPGVDIVFNTNKHKGTPMMGEDKNNTVLKPLKDSESMPFGSVIRQFEYDGADGKKHQSPINIVNDDEDWGKWKKEISSQMLSKQRPEVAKKQLDLTYESKKAQFDDIKAITNPVLRQKLLQEFADECDSSAVHLSAMGFSRQASHVILPVDSLKDNEIYAPNYKNGEEVILVRHPHGDIVEIPVLKVTNKNPEGKKTLGQAQHAVGINANVAGQLSGADFDGDTVIVIPTAGQKFKTSKDLPASSKLHQLKDFSTTESFPAYEGMPETGPKHGFNKQMQMGSVSNLITDMNIKGATEEERARALKHSMVVIDAEKHNLNWRASEKEFDIKGLKAKYQGGANRGASTVISRATSVERVGVRGNKWHVRGDYDIDPSTGKKVFTYYNETYVDKNGKTQDRTFESTKMYETDDAFTLSSGGSKETAKPIEKVYATYANQMKDLGNQARKASLSTGTYTYSPSAKETYRAEVDSLNAKLNVAKKHAPQERKAQVMTNKIVATLKEENPSLKEDKSKLRKVTAQVLNEQRERAGGRKQRIEITEKEWEAIEAGAITKSKLTDILNNTDTDVIVRYAMPRTSSGLTKGQIAQAKAMLAIVDSTGSSRYTQKEVAERLGVSPTTLMKAVNG